ncbi:monocarboxylate transporter 12 isoform X1 [Tribolium castaneum]|uniref:monocarboxylate transporter 12 isoform X1 n=1 Tax=Tribolium castaneum TaxID=7070 RepID=UPI00077DA165|nr:PREDICTED: monocarboxylate transporter 12 isoform X1 [Tribolium castaneum]XP_015840592.1 PREDICTED: monocarboxylate transporter 12 isoform X1 [Tribolium castaneum]|eukprot:XP_015840591.1 PREDICTED: monocarboxylate transporter 12 isoform X1 [Tribolium castaneum]
MTLNHSKTWPVSTLAVVQLRVDSHGRTYSTLTGNPAEAPELRARHEDSGLVEENHNSENGTNEVENLRMAGRRTVRTDTVSTILEQDTEFEEQPEEPGKCDPSLEKFHVLALTRIEENLNEGEFYALGRRPSIKVDNWDFIYTETKPNRCPIHDPAPKEPPDLPLDARKTTTLRRHYYLEGGWGWVVVVCSVLVHVLNHGVQLSCSQLVLPGADKFKVETVHFAGWLGAMSTGVALLISPVTIAFCRRKSTRVTAVMGGLITALGCLFTSFATQFHQLFFSYGTVVGIGVGITRDCSTLMVAQYFKRRREFVEIFIVSGSGLGIATMSVIIRSTIGALGWRLGLQVVTGAISVTFILGTFYRSASLYHPQRRAILHIKNQKRKIKDKNKIEDKIPFFDFSTLKSKTVRILLISTGISAFGINTPLFYLAYQAEVEGLGDSTVFLQMYLGLAWTVGCVVFSTLVLHNSTECRIARQYLCQTAVFMCGLSILAFTVVSGNYHAYVMFAWIYGIFCGGYHYSLKMYTYERVRARNFARTWGFVQCSQAIPIVIGVPFSGYMNEKCGDRAGYYFSSTCVIVGSLTLFLIDLHRRKISRHKHTRENGTRHLCVSETCPQRRKLSFSQEPENDAGVTAGAAAAALVLGADLAPNQPAGLIDNIIVSNDKPELTCISEEGIADMDLPDNLLDDLDYIGDCITSCNKVENYLMLSEFENNLIAEMPVILDRKGRRWSLARSKLAQNEEGDEENGVGVNNSKWKVFPNRVITVIDESSV